jgi:ParB family chromosome partitioning protein
MEPRKIQVKSSGLLSSDQQSERERRLAMAVNRLPSFSTAAPTAAVEPQGADEAQAVLVAQRLDPRLIVRSRWANRHELNFDGAEFAELREEIRQAGGNVQPIKVRPLAELSAAKPGEVAPRYEIVFGHRRHEACRLESLPVLALIVQLTDQQLFVEMDRENRSRKNLTAWEQGVMYRRALETGLFTSKRALAGALGVDHSALSKAVVLAELPQQVVDAFPSPLELQFRWGQPLAAVFAADPSAVLQRAQNLMSRRGELSAKEIFDFLLGNPSVASEQANSIEPIRIDQSGRRAEVSMTPKGGAVVSIEPGSIRPDRIKVLAELVTRFLAED